ncbi:SGNH hydrolase-type esterase domain-containing protein [Xylaria palmicola]|nr:SGNH hydrolase-type esterase domain-containing protein [Xylaria palmicola]
MSSEFEKPVVSPRRSRFAFLRTKRAIIALTILVIASAVLIALGAAHILTPSHSHTSISNSNSIGDSLGGGNNDSNSDSNSGGNSGSNDASGDGNDEDDSDDDDNDDDNKGTTQKSGSWRPSNSSSIADGTPLRIMCLGASIVRGETSPDNNGFRKPLREELAGLGVPVNMVGSQRYGDMPDNDHEAYGGKKVAQIHDYATRVVPGMRPNVFVINVGTNNVLQRVDIDVAGEQMEAFIDYLLGGSPRATVILSTLLTNTVPDREPLILDINQQFRNVFKKYARKPVVLAELHPSEGVPGVPQIEDIGPDGSHPTEEGYQIMGHLLAEAVKEADEKGYLRWPEDGPAYDGEIGRVDATSAEDTAAESASGTSSTGE